MLLSFSILLYYLKQLCVTFVHLGKYAELQPSIQELSEKEQHIQRLEEENMRDRRELEELRERNISLQATLESTQQENARLLKTTGSRHSFVRYGGDSSSSMKETQL